MASFIQLALFVALTTSLSVNLYDQCGGKGSVCYQQNNCADKQWADCAGACTRQNEWYWQCLPQPSSISSSKATSSSSSSSQNTKPTQAVQPPPSKNTSVDQGQASLTWYSKGITASNYPTTACGFTQQQWTSSGPLAAISQNLFGVGPGQGAGPSCGTCYNLEAVKGIASGQSVSLPRLKVKIEDLCPFEGGAPSDTGGGNQQWCMDKMVPNNYGFVVHFDLMVESLYGVQAWKNKAYQGNLVVNYQKVAC